MQNRAIRITKSLHKYDHVTLHCRELNWLPISLMVQLQSIAAMSHYFQQRETLQLDPPILFGHQHSNGTCCSDCFANPYTYQLSRTMKYFHSSVSTWWNDADSMIRFPPRIPHCDLVNCVKSMK